MAKRQDSLQTAAEQQRGKPFPKGQSGNPNGRRKGTPNKATTEAKAACAAIVDDEAYRKKLISRARAGKLPPAVECMLWHYAKGKPKELVEHTGPDGQPIQVEQKVRFYIPDNGRDTD